MRPRPGIMKLAMIYWSAENVSQWFSKMLYIPVELSYVSALLRSEMLMGFLKIRYKHSFLQLLRQFFGQMNPISFTSIFRGPHKFGFWCSTMNAFPLFLISYKQFYKHLSPICYFNLVLYIYKSKCVLVGYSILLHVHFTFTFALLKISCWPKFL